MVAEAMGKLSATKQVSGMVVNIDGNTAWLRPPAATLRLTVTDQKGGARVPCRFDPSHWDEINLSIYGGALAIGVAVASSWPTGPAPPAVRAKITVGAPVFMAALGIPIG